ncbi:MAG: T9SS type A sorting domain-containing protein, partial [Bacteroidota bacterium]
HVSVTPSICMVTYDSVTNRNKIVMTSVSSVIFFHYNIYKLGSTSNYEFIGDVSTLENEFIDTTSIPYQKPYTYKISVVGDTIVSMKSPSHTTIWLHYEKTGNQVDLLWTPYSGFTFDSYHIYRKVGSGSWNQIGLNNNSTLVFTDIYTGTDNPTYYVEVVPPCSTKSSGQTVTSNKVKIGGVGIDSKSYMDVHIFPNPVNKTLTLELQKPGNRMFRVYDLLGKEWLTLSSDQEKINLNVETIPPGIYILKIQSESSTTTTKFCKE